LICAVVPLTVDFSKNKMEIKYMLYEYRLQSMNEEEIIYSKIKDSK